MTIDYPAHERLVNYTEELNDAYEGWFEIKESSIQSLIMEYQHLKSIADLVVPALEGFIEAWEGNESESDMFNKCDAACTIAKEALTNSKNGA